ncbi:MAG: OmpA family protein [Bacteroidota bacterium]
MKSSIFFHVFLLTLSAQSQIRFQGQPVPVIDLNSSRGQNYVVLHPKFAELAFTEESGGSGGENEIVEMKSDSARVFVFRDWLSTKGMVSPLGFTDESLFYNQVMFDKGSYKGVVIKINQKDRKREKVNIPFMKNKSPIQSGCISENGQYMILSMESNNTYGVEDLYLSRKKADGNWSSFDNLGAGLNTEYQEITPFLAVDNKTLFFATNGRDGKGGFDLFYSIRQDDSWRNWSEPINLGNQINSSGSETSFAFRDGEDWAYFVSSKDSDGYGDIMKIKILEDIAKDTTLIDQPVAVDSMEREQPTSVLMKVVDASSYVQIPSVLITPLKKFNNTSGRFILDSILGSEVEVKSKGYLSKVIHIDSSFLTGENVVALNAVSKGNTIQLDKVLFQRGTANLVLGSEKELDLVVEVMNDNPRIKILLKGHTDNTGDPVKNIGLSKARVKTVKEYILSKGISPYRVRGKGFGENQPIASNETEETRKLNRRVEFEVIDD